MASFFFLPHVNFVALFGLDHFEPAMRAQHALTQRFTAEFSIRPFLERHESATLVRLTEWAADPSEHVRRLVSEGTRPRLPWAGRLRRFQADPTPVLALLERLKDDPSEYVRRSVANNLNDIGKDHPDLLVRVAKRWLVDAGEQRRALVRHALRSLVKAGHPGALRVLGYGREADVECRDVTFAPARVANGGKVTITFAVANGASRRQRVLVDLRVHFVKSTGRATPKVFKLKTMDLAPGEHAAIRKTISLAPMTTRKHYAGKHIVDVLVNGRVTPLGAFTVV
jgi:3-methyladenine DNA glycosylase AlkC